MTAGQHIDYEALAQEAMRGVVRAVLTKVGETGLLGDHHFYIAFNTQGPGVNISKRLKEKYPEEMTIVLQHLFWDLEVNDERFEVKLRFDGIPERLVVPFRCVKVFYDPSVPYGLQFEESELMTQNGRRPPRDLRKDGGDDEFAGAGSRPQGDRAEKRRERTPRRTRPTEVKPAAAELDAKTPTLAKPKAAPVVASPVPAPAARPQLADVKSSQSEPVTDKSEDPPKTDPDTTGGSKVVDFSKFRNTKK